MLLKYTAFVVFCMYMYIYFSTGLPLICDLVIGKLVFSKYWQYIYIGYSIIRENDNYFSHFPGYIYSL